METRTVEIFFDITEHCKFIQYKKDGKILRLLDEIKIRPSDNRRTEFIKPREIDADLKLKPVMIISMTEQAERIRQQQLADTYRRVNNTVPEAIVFAAMGRLASWGQERFPICRMYSTGTDLYAMYMTNPDGPSRFTLTAVFDPNEISYSFHS